MGGATFGCARILSSQIGNRGGGMENGHVMFDGLLLGSECGFSGGMCLFHQGDDAVRANVFPIRSADLLRWPGNTAWCRFHCFLNQSNP